VSPQNLCGAAGDQSRRGPLNAFVPYCFKLLL
jgi:hypothetical protein